MTGQSTSISPQRLARRTGVLYVVVVLCGVAGEILVTNMVVVAGDTAATVDRIISMGFVFRLGFVVLLARLVFLVLLILALDRLFGRVDRGVAAAMVAFGLVSVAVSMVALVFEFGAPLLLTSNDYSARFTPDQWQAQVQFFIEMQEQADRAAQVLAVWVLLLGVLIYRSGYVPKPLGILMMAAGVGYVVDFLIFVLVPQVDWQIAGLAFLAEVAFPIWLLVKGIDIAGWERRSEAG